MMDRDEYLIKFIQCMQDEIEIMDVDELYDSLEHILDVLIHNQKY